MARFRWGWVTGLLLLGGIACRPSKLLLTPVPEQIERLEGYAQLTIRNGPDQSRSKFAFNFDLPSRGRIEVSNLLGTMYRILFAEGKAYFILPSKKIYWEGQEEEIIEKFLGFPVSLTEMTSFFTGQWPPTGSNPQEISAWHLEKDRENRIRSGYRTDLSFRVEKFIAATRIPHTLAFDHVFVSGRIKFLNLSFNRPLRQNLFSLLFLKRYQEKSWEEIQVYLNRIP